MAISELLNKRTPEITYALGTFTASALTFLLSLIAARFITPEEMGILQTLMLIPVYLGFLHGGVFNGLSRNVAFYLGSGDSAKVQAMVNSSWRTAQFTASIGTFVALSLILYFALSAKGAIYLCGMIIVLATLAFEPFSQHLDAIYLSTRNFQSLAVALWRQNVITSLSCVLPSLLGVMGVVLSRTIYVSSRLFTRLWGVPLSAEKGGPAGEARELLHTGFPLLLAGVLYAYLGAADRTLVAWSLNPSAVGHLTLSTLLTTALQLVPQCVAALLSPRVAAHYGRTGSRRSLRSFFWLSLAIGLFVTVPLCVLAYLAVGPLTRWILPAYTPGIEAARIAAISCISFSSISVSVIITVIRANTPYIVTILAALFGMWLSGPVLIRHYGLEGAIIAKGIATALLCVFTIGFAYHLTTRDATE